MTNSEKLCQNTKKPHPLGVWFLKFRLGHQNRLVGLRKMIPRMAYFVQGIIKALRATPTGGVVLLIVNLEIPVEIVLSA